MPRVNLEKYYNGFFKNDINTEKEIFCEINRAHVISSLYYDINCGMHNLIYRDKFNAISIPIESDIVNHAIVIYFDSFISEKSSKLKNIDSRVLKERIINGLVFIKMKHNFE